MLLTFESRRKRCCMTNVQPSRGEGPDREDGADYRDLIFPDPALVSREVAADQLMRRVAYGFGEPSPNPLDQAVFGTLRAEWRRILSGMRESLDGAIPITDRLRYASLFAPESLPSVLPNPRLVQLNRAEVRHNFRRYTFACHLRNRDGESLVVSPDGLFAFSGVVNPSGERPVAVMEVSVDVPLGDRERYLAEPRSLKPRVRILLNRAAFDEQLNLIRSGEILDFSPPQLSVPLWAETLRVLESLTRRRSAESAENRPDVYSIRPAGPDRPPEEVVLETSFGAVLAKMFFHGHPTTGGGNVFCGWADSIRPER